MPARNTTEVNPGSSITLDIRFRAYYGGPLTNADVMPTYEIYDPEDVLLESGTATHISTGYYTATYNVPLTADYSDYYKIEWTAVVNTTVVGDAWEYFRVVPATPAYEGVTISTEWLNHIKLVLAYPKVSKILLTDDEIKQYAIFPALTQYFTKFPIKETTELYSSDLIEINFPDSYTYGLVDCRVVDIGTIGGTGSSFWDIISYQRMGILGRSNMYNKRGYNPNGLYQQRFHMQQAMKSQQNALVTIKFNVDYPNRKVTVYSSTTGKINITWAKFSNDFESVLYQRKLDVVDLAQANLLDHLCDTFGIISDTTLDVNINVTELRTRAKDLREAVLSKWMEFPSVILLKNV